jgi:hypothetical protein
MFEWFTGWFGDKPIVIDNEFSSERVGKIAAKALKNPSSLTEDEIKSLAASVLTQRPNKK